MIFSETFFERFCFCLGLKQLRWDLKIALLKNQGNFHINTKSLKGFVRSFIVHQEDKDKKWYCFFFMWTKLFWFCFQHFQFYYNLKTFVFEISKAKFQFFKFSNFQIYDITYARDLMFSLVTPVICPTVPMLGHSDIFQAVLGLTSWYVIWRKVMSHGTIFGL